jgi:hypothetical protein
VITDTDTTLATLRDMSTRLTDESGSESFFIYYEEDFFLLFDVFCQCLLYDLTKIPFLLSHIDEIECFVWVGMLKEFVVDEVYSVLIKSICLCPSGVKENCNLTQDESVYSSSRFGRSMQMRSCSSIASNIHLLKASSCFSKR